MPQIIDPVPSDSAVATRPNFHDLAGQLVAQVKQAHDQEGGSTTNIKFGNLVGKPYFAVGVHPERAQILDHTPSQEELEAFVQKNLDLLGTDKFSIGTWADPYTGKHVLDISATTPSMKQALQLAGQHGQEDIFDLKGLVTMMVPQKFKPKGKPAQIAPPPSQSGP